MLKWLMNSWLDGWLRKHPILAAVISVVVLIGSVGGGIQIIIQVFNSLGKVEGFPLTFVIVVGIISLIFGIAGISLLVKVVQQTKRETLNEHLEKVKANLLEYKRQLQLVLDASESQPFRQNYSTLIEKNDRIFSQIKSHCPRLSALRSSFAMKVLLYTATKYTANSVEVNKHDNTRADIRNALTEMVKAVDDCLVTNEYTKNRCYDCPPKEKFRK